MNDNDQEYSVDLGNDQAGIENEIEVHLWKALLGADSIGLTMVSYLLKMAIEDLKSPGLNQSDPRAV